ncbi:hypothetical protein [Streptomyces niveiscabiei]|uniref:Uncharacterized protein n=1 Tax=Streptomyces niveiscabiei TaxID=164115 RepID=A0ABW9HUJ7_9ACTN
MSDLVGDARYLSPSVLEALRLRLTGNRLSVNAMSAISAKGRTHFVVFPESFTTDVMCRFPERLAAHLDNVEPHFLPPVLAAETRRSFHRRRRRPHIVRGHVEYVDNKFGAGAGRPSSIR